MAIVITSQPTDTIVVEGVITATLAVVASGATSYQWRQAKSSVSTADATVLVGETGSEMVIPADLPVGTYYYFCSVSDDTDTVNTAIATVTVSDFPEYITGSFVLDYIDKCSEEVQNRFQELQTLRGITILNNNNALRTAQIELFMEAL